MRCEWRDSDGALDDERWTYARLRGYHGPLTTRSVASVLRAMRLRRGGRR